MRITNNPLFFIHIKIAWLPKKKKKTNDIEKKNKKKGNEKIKTKKGGQFLAVQFQFAHETSGL